MLSSMYVILTFPALEFLIRKLKKICRFSLFYAYHCIECSPYLLATYYSIFISKIIKKKRLYCFLTIIQVVNISTFLKVPVALGVVL